MIAHRVPVHEAQEYLGQATWAPAVAFVGRKGEQVVGAGGLAWGYGKCWLWLNVIEQGQSVWAMRTMFAKVMKLARNLGDDVIYCIRDAAQPTSERLLRVFGFRPTGQTLAQMVGVDVTGEDADREVWAWRS